mmetsp:Transcript_58707/g.156945  ORF Transcript_58707/g.156945 Transcript_58707/m.156945 type:complete len:195 (+) Transcript_58707:93-677(+)
MYGLRLINNKYPTTAGGGRDTVVFRSHDFRSGKQDLARHTVHTPNKFDFSMPNKNPRSGEKLWNFLEARPKHNISGSSLKETERKKTLRSFGPQFSWDTPQQEFERALPTRPREAWGGSDRLAATPEMSASQRSSSAYTREFGLTRGFQWEQPPKSDDGPDYRDLKATVPPARIMAAHGSSRTRYGGTWANSGV